jgi:hypothetical protein
MPVNVDTVYQTVQALANKEQRGYLTPQEFNLFANQAQTDIFEQYFYDLNAFKKQGPQAREVGDSVTHVQHKIINTNGITVSNSTPCTYSGANGIWTLPTGNLTGKIFFANTSGDRRELIILPGHIEELLNLKGSRWHSTSDETFYFEDGWGRIQVHDVSGPVATGITCETVIGNPDLVYWGYVVVNETPIYDSVNSQNFSLHFSEQADLVIKILKLAGISTEDSTLYQAGSQEEQQNIQQENK